MLRGFNPSLWFSTPSDRDLETSRISGLERVTRPLSKTPHTPTGELAGYSHYTSHSVISSENPAQHSGIKILHSNPDRGIQGPYSRVNPHRNIRRQPQSIDHPRTRHSERWCNDPLSINLGTYHNLTKYPDYADNTFYCPTPRPCKCGSLVLASAHLSPSLCDQATYVLAIFSHTKLLEMAEMVIMLYNSCRDYLNGR